jgi:hypothetical protein
VKTQLKQNVFVLCQNKVIFLRLGNGKRHSLLPLTTTFHEDTQVSFPPSVTDKIKPTPINQESTTHARFWVMTK